MLVLGPSGIEDSFPPLRGGNVWAYLLLILFLTFMGKEIEKFPAQ